MALRQYVLGRRLYWMEIGTLFAMRLFLCLRFRLRSIPKTHSAQLTELATG